MKYLKLEPHPEVPDYLANYDDYWIRRRVAENPNTSPETLERLVNDGNSRVRRAVARNPNTSPETLEHLANDEDWSVRCHVAYNHNTQPETLERLAIDYDRFVRCNVAGNPNTPSILKENMKDEREMRQIMTTDPETLDSVSFLRWLDCADVDSLESFANRHIVT